MLAPTAKPVTNAPKQHDAFNIGYKAINLIKHAISTLPNYNSTTIGQPPPPQQQYHTQPSSSSQQQPLAQQQIPSAPQQQHQHQQSRRTSSTR
jgi:hypothetical protein